MWVETIGKIRGWHRVDKLSISKIARRLSASRNTIAKYLQGELTKPRYKKRAKRAPVMGAWVVKLEAMLGADAKLPRKEQRTAQRLLDALMREGFTGSYPTVQRFVRAWHEQRRHSPGSVFIPQSFAPGEAYQFDWSYETVDLGGRATPVKVAHLRLCHSRVFLVVAYLREAQEMVFDAHWRAFSLWGGSCQRGIYDNLKTAVELIFTGKARQYNRKFLQMASHYLIEPVACTPGAGWAKGQVENQVGHVRENIFTPRLRCTDLAELNALLARRCVQLAQATRHPEQRERSRWEVFEASERALLVPVTIPFEGCAERAKSGSARAHWCTWIVTATAWIAAMRARRCRCAPTRIGSWRWPRATSSGSMCAVSNVIAPSSTPGTTWRHWRRSRGHCATVPRSRTGRSRRPCAR